MGESGQSPAFSILPLTHAESDPGEAGGSKDQGESRRHFQAHAGLPANSRHPAPSAPSLARAARGSCGRIIYASGDCGSLQRFKSCCKKVILDCLPAGAPRPPDRKIQQKKFPCSTPSALRFRGREHQVEQRVALLACSTPRMVVVVCYVVIVANMAAERGRPIEVVKMQESGCLAGGLDCMANSRERE